MSQCTLINLLNPATSNQYFFFYNAPSKTALLEGLEVDQYMLGILVYIQK